jgi:hypothetical protein
MKINDIQDSDLFDSILNNCIVRVGSYFVKNHNINIYFNSKCLDALIIHTMQYLIMLINAYKFNTDNNLFSSFLNYIGKCRNDIEHEDFIYIKNILNTIIDTVIFTLKTHHPNSDINNVIEHYIKYSTCDDMLYICNGIIKKFDEE